MSSLRDCYLSRWLCYNNVIPSGFLFGAMIWYRLKSLPIFAAMYFNILRLSLFISLLSLFTLFTRAGSIDTVAWEQGRALFKSNCAVCHNPTVPQTGPALTGVTRRWEGAGQYQGKSGRQWLYSWIKNWNGPVAAQYPYAVAMQNYSATQMSIFPTLSDSDISLILLYVEHPRTAANPAMQKDDPGHWGVYFLYIMLGAVLLAFAVLFFATSRQ
jgi:mono/diheme cytochrome c family protein